MKLIVKQKLKLNIMRQGINGEGIGYFNRIAVFVPGAIRKEIVNVEVVQSFDNYAVAKIIDIERKSTKRVLPPCKFYEECGHCDMQHIDYKEQLKIKQLILEQSFKRYTKLNNVKGKIDLTLHDRLDYNYSNYQEIVLRNTNYGLALGYYKPLTNHFVKIDQCIVNDSEINEIAQLSLSLFKKHKLKAYDLRNQEGILYNLAVRYFSNTDSANIVIVTKEYVKELKLIAQEIIENFKSVKSVGYSIYNPDSRAMVDGVITKLAGTDQLQTAFHGKDVYISTAGAYPENVSVYEKLDQAILNYGRLSEKDTLVNMYNLSTITSLFYADYVKKVIAIDYFDVSVKDCKKNIEYLKINNIEIIQDHVERALPKLLKSKIKIDAIVLNAPKHGISKTVVDLLNKYKVKQVIYVSKNPSSLAKDIDQLTESYQVRKIIPVDLFPQTSRVDSITILEKI